MEENLENWESISNKYQIDNFIPDLIIVLAGGLNEKGEVHEWVRRRLERTVDLYERHQVPILCCGGGTYHKPPFLNSGNFVVHESTECVNFLVQAGIKKEMIYREWSSYDTIANAFFSLTTHVWCNPKFQKIAIITSEFHMDRTKEIFNWIYSLEKKNYLLKYYPVTDFGLDRDMIVSRKLREEKSLENVKRLKGEITSISKFHDWLYKKHNAYNNNFIIEKEVDSDCQKSY